MVARGWSQMKSSPRIASKPNVEEGGKTRAWWPGGTGTLWQLSHLPSAPHLAQRGCPCCWLSP